MTELENAIEWLESHIYCAEININCNMCKYKDNCKDDLSDGLKSMHYMLNVMHEKQKLEK